MYMPQIENYGLKYHKPCPFGHNHPSPGGMGSSTHIRIGYNHKDHTCSLAHRKLPSATEHPNIISKYAGIEVAKGRMLGPFPTYYIPDIQSNRIGVIHKESNPGKWRLITDLSFPPGQSVNYGIAQHHHSHILELTK